MLQACYKRRRRCATIRRASASAVRRSSVDKYSSVSSGFNNSALSLPTRDHLITGMFPICYDIIQGISFAGIVLAEFVHAAVPVNEFCSDLPGPSYSPFRFCGAGRRACPSATPVKGGYQASLQGPLHPEKMFYIFDGHPGVDASRLVCAPGGLRSGFLARHGERSLACRWPSLWATCRRSMSAGFCPAFEAA